MNIQTLKKGEKPVVAISLATILNLDTSNKAAVAAVQAQGGNISRIINSLIKGAKTKADANGWEKIDDKLSAIGFAAQANKLAAAFDNLPGEATPVPLAAVKGAPKAKTASKSDDTESD
jgi:hypothetical protein